MGAALRLSEHEEMEYLALLEQEAHYQHLVWKQRNQNYLRLMKYQRPLVKRRDWSYLAILATRRAGKSHGGCAWLIDGCMARAGANCFYLGLTRNSARRIAWKVLKGLCRDLGIRAQFKEAELVVEFENGSTIYLYGVNQENVLDNLRGVPIDRCLLDEAGSFRGGIVDELLDEVVGPAFADYDGQFLMIGTPTPVLSGTFYEATTGHPARQEFQTMHWDLRNNRFLAQQHKGGIKAWLAEYLKKKGWSADNPKFLREFCGQWVPGDDLQVFKFSGIRNVVDAPHHMISHTVMGLDLGHRDDTAWSVLGFSTKASRNVYVVEQTNAPQLSISDVVTRTMDLYKKWRPYVIVVDPGAGGAQLVPDLVERYGLPAIAAEKVNKRAGIELVNDALLAPSFFIASPGGLAREWQNLVWRDKEKRNEDPRLPNHLSDATLYAYRECFAFLHSPHKIFGSSAEASAAREDQEMDELEDEIRRDDEKEKQEKAEVSEWDNSWTAW